MFKPVSAKEERLLPVYVYGSESLEHQTQISRGKGFMLHSQISVCYSGEGVFTDHNNVSHKVQSGDIMYLLPQHQIHINPPLFHGKQTTSLWADMLLLSL